MILLAKLDRLAIGSILRSKLVFLINVRPQHQHSSRVRVFETSVSEANVRHAFCRVCGHW